MLDWRNLALLSDAELSRLDVAAVNLACAAWLPDAPTEAQILECLDRLDHYARCAEDYTRRRMAEFARQPETYDHSEPVFRVVCMVTLLQRQFGVLYNQEKKSESALLDTTDTFVHGALVGSGGTCASLPVVYVAVGRRLGYPLKLVQACGHLFCRWDDGGAQPFNIEVNDTGTSSPPDDYYRTGRYELSPAIENQTIFLKSQTPRQELAGFLANRGHRWLDLGRNREAAESFVWASTLAPAHKLHEFDAVTALTRWRDRLRQLTPPDLPPLQVNMPSVRRYPAIPAAVEADMIRFEVWERVLQNLEGQHRVMGPMRSSSSANGPANTPRKIVVDVTR
jgi:hypothetical protein